MVSLKNKKLFLMMLIFSLSYASLYANTTENKINFADRKAEILNKKQSSQEVLPKNNFSAEGAFQDYGNSSKTAGILFILSMTITFLLIGSLVIIKSPKQA